MDDGVIVADGAPGDLLDNPIEPRLREFLSHVL
jgi:ABC-type histidine transport system ATPase subunit